ncbi:fungal-specific transcription factor domain-containing protein [Penicillium fimorum]|uniref:Fungal-specific transcription factor domain-containing protein n=1 Tax=Penicillium fimorum TaxID=1882269 RepID=A0A9X0C7E5_9EURO|nr:fungal-specific transcription factor domain-containing protein [Penicillium fimorum]
MTVKERYTRRVARSPKSNGAACQEKLVTPETSTIREQQDQGPNVPAPEALHRQYLGGMTYMLYNAPGIPPNYRRITSTSTTRDQEILTIIDPTSPPPAILLNAYVDAYFKHVFHRLPIVDRADFSSSKPSVALQQAICMVGTILRHPKGPDILAENEKYYYNVKTLIHTNHEQDPITVLKVMCLFSTRNIAGPVLLTIDSPWQWVVIAIRLLQQMGLHREEICAAFVNPKIARRLAWSLFVRVSQIQFYFY